MKKTFLLSVTALGLLWTCQPALGGVLDAPLPVLDPSRSTRLLYLIPGVIKNKNIETIVECTSLDRSPAFFGVQVFNFDGTGPLNPPDPGSDGILLIQPGETLSIATGEIAGLHEDEKIGTSANPIGPVTNGSARVVGTTKKLICSAFLVDQLGDPPASMAGLRIISKKQRGD